MLISRGKAIVAEIRPVKREKKPFPFGIWQEKMTLDLNWDSPETNRQVEELFYGDGEK